MSCALPCYKSTFISPVLPLNKFNLKRNILRTFIPKGYLITVVVALFFVLIGGEYVVLANIAFNILLFLFGVQLAVFVHEIGHLMFAKFVGGTPRRMILGKGHKVFQKEFYGVKVTLNSTFNSGLAYAAFDNLKFIRIKLFIFTCGGFVFNFIIACVLFLLFDFSTKASEGIHFASAIGIANLLVGISTLVPHYASYQGLRLYSDGLSILRIPFHKKSKLVELSSVNELLDAYDLFEAKKYEEAIEIYELFQSKSEGSKKANLNLSIAYMKLGKFQKALELMEELLPLIEEEPFNRYKNLIYNGLAWEYLLLNRLDEADLFSKLAYEAEPNNEHIRGTRASVLIEKGNLEEGKNLILNDVDFNFPNNQTISAAIYLGLLFSKQGDCKKAMKYIRFVDNNIELLDVDERILYDRVVEKMTIHSSTYDERSLIGKDAYRKFE